MTEQVQDIQFDENDTKEMLVRKLRILQDEVVRLSRSQPLSVNDAGVVDFGAISLSDTASAGSRPVPANADSFMDITINGIPVRIALFRP